MAAGNYWTHPSLYAILLIPDYKWGINIQGKILPNLKSYCHFFLQLWSIFNDSWSSVHAILYFHKSTQNSEIAELSTCVK